MYGATTAAALAGVSRRSRGNQGNQGNQGSNQAYPSHRSYKRMYQESEAPSPPPYVPPPPVRPSTPLLNSISSKALKESQDYETKFAVNEKKRIENMSVSELKNALKEYRYPTSRKERLNKGTQRLFGYRTNKNAKKELVDLAMITIYQDTVYRKRNGLMSLDYFVKKLVDALDERDRAIYNEEKRSYDKYQHDYTEYIEKYIPKPFVHEYDGVSSMQGYGGKRLTRRNRK